MLNKNLKKLQASGRLSIPFDLRTYAGLHTNDDIALCYHEESGGIMIKPLDKIQDCKIITIQKMDIHGRIVIPKKLMPEGREEVFVDVYLFNDDLVIERVDV